MFEEDEDTFVNETEELFVSEDVVDPLFADEDESNISRTPNIPKKDKITDGDDPDDLVSFWKAPEDADTSLTPEQQLEVAETAKQNMSAQMRRIIDGYTIPEDMIPDDFNVADPAQLRGLLAKTGQSAIENTLSVMFPPIQQAMDDMRTEFEGRLEEAVQNGFDNNNTESRLMREIPAAADPKTAKFVKVAFAQAQLNHKGNTTAAINATKRIIETAGIKISGSKKRTGTEKNLGLDSMAPLPSRPVAQTRNLLRS